MSTEMYDEYFGHFSVEDASSFEVTQLSASGCGVTALVNVLLALNMVEKEKISDVDYSDCTLRKRANDSPLPEYLASRGVAGCTGSELASSMPRMLLKNGLPEMICKFIPFSELNVEIKLCEVVSSYLVNKYAVVTTLNLQLFGNDAWHHQMIFGVNVSKGLLHFMNPVCMYDEQTVSMLMSTPNQLLVRRDDVVSRFKGEVREDFSRPDWIKYHVFEQIEAMMADSALTHLLLPANYIGGITVFKCL